MLLNLYIKNYLLIEELLIDFKDGLTTITGETGAGKSIILGALGLILGERTNTKTLLNENHKCIVEGVFNLKNYHLKDLFEENNLDYDNNCIIRREISPNGKSRAFVNDTPCSLTLLKELTQKLVDLHSQFANSLVANESFRINLIDSFSGNTKIYNQYLTQFHKYRNLKKEINNLQEELDIAIKDIDYYKFQTNQIEQAKLDDENELEELEHELTILENAEDIKLTLNETYTILDEDENGVIQLLKQARNKLEKVGKHSNEINELSERIDSVLIELRDIANCTDTINSSIDIDPKRQELVSERLDLINNLLNKFRLSSIVELKQIYHEFLGKIGNTDKLEKELEAKIAELNKLKIELLTTAKELSKKRKLNIIDIENSIINKLDKLGMPDVRFTLNLTTNSEPSIYGLDSISFMFAASKNLPLQEVHNAASGGELSRIMLCLKSLIDITEAVPTLIFDEIDTGVSGEIADSMGKIMQQMSNKQQIISITHLPQVAARGINHYKVYKQNNDKGSITKMKLLSKDERVNEIASMLSGEKITDTAISNAKSLLDMALQF
ncbi:MAG: DNA repair protein RecN [Bacteroidales bacterium]|nr:DNA repair protein RecN [Bacteroidales bacterium]